MMAFSISWPTTRATSLLALLLLMVSMSGVGAAGAATEVELSGTFGNRAVLAVNGTAPKTFTVGEPAKDGIRLLEVGSAFAIIEADGRRQTLRLGGGPVRAGEGGGSATEVNLTADARGHYFASGGINGATVRFLVDTGASMVSIGMSDAKRAGINFRQGQAGISETASGPARVWRVRLDSVRLGDITLHGVDGIVHENDLPFVLLGMSFLNRMDMQREGGRLVLRQRF